MSSTCMKTPITTICMTILIGLSNLKYTCKPIMFRHCTDTLAGFPKAYNHQTSMIILFVWNQYHYECCQNLSIVEGVFSWQSTTACTHGLAQFLMLSLRYSETLIRQGCITLSHILIYSTVLMHCRLLPVRCNMYNLDRSAGDQG